MIASPPIETAVDWPSPAAVKVEDISVVMPPEREITPTGPGGEDVAASLAGPPIPPILITSGTMIPRQFGPMMRAPCSSANSTIWATSPRGMRSVTMTTSFTPLSIASMTASLVKAGGTVTTGPSIGASLCSTAWGEVAPRAADRRAVVLDGLADGVEPRHGLHPPAEATGRHPADDPRAGAVVE